MGLGPWRFILGFVHYHFYSAEYGTDWPSPLFLGAEFYLYPTVNTALIHLIKPELIRCNWIEYGVRSNWVVTWWVVTIKRIVVNKIFINKKLRYKYIDNKAGTVYSIIQFNLG